MDCSQAGRLGGISRSAKKVEASKANIRKAHEVRRQKARKLRKILAFTKANPQLVEGLLFSEE